MNITGAQSINLPREAVWDALRDPEVLRKCLAGCESVQQRSEQEFQIVLTSAIGPLRAKFNGMLRLSEEKPPASCVLTFEGNGGPLGFGKGTAHVELREQGTATELRYTSDVQVGGKLAQVGSRLIDAAAKKMTEEFFTAFRQHWETGDVEPQRVAMAVAEPRIGNAIAAGARAIPLWAWAMLAAGIGIACLWLAR